MKRFLFILIVFFLASSLSSCATINKAKQYDRMRETIYDLKAELERERTLKDEAISQITQDKATLLAAKDSEIARLVDEKEELKTACDLYLTKEAESKTLLNQKEKEITDAKAALESLKVRNDAMNTKILSLETQKDDVLETVEEKETKISELEQARIELEQSLKSELEQYKAKLKMTERGLVITFLAEIFFDSGKNIILEEAKPTLDKVASVLNTKVADSYIAVEGYTDNDPILHSVWTSNWELSSARALSVLHYLISSNNVNPKRLSAIGYGEHRPVISNATTEGKQQNRRVEIVILPTKLEKVK